MARIRTIKPEFWTSEQVVECSPTARLLFIGLWNFCDDAGNHPAGAKTIKMQIFPGDDIPLSSIDGLLQELVNNGLLARYESEGRQYFHVTGWHHQKIEKPSFKYPKPSFGELSANGRRQSAPGMEGKGEEGKGGEGKGRDVSPSDARAAEEARLREMRDKQRQEQDERIRFPMTAEWTPDAKILNDHLRFAGPNGMLNGKPVIAEDLTEEILAGFRSLAFRKQESCTKHDWHGGLASYLVKRLKNGPKPGNVHQIPSASSQETKPKGDGSLWYCSQPLPKRPPREERTDEEIAAMIAEGRKAMEAAR